MIYQHPLAYLVGLQGRALLRAFAGEYDRDFTLARLAEVRALLDSADVLGEGTSLSPVNVADGYETWAPRYDEPGNAMVDTEEPLVRALLDRILDGDQRRTVLDAACGTGRHAAYIAARGHRVIGTDRSPAMLALARDKLPDAELHEADLVAIPLDDASVDVVVCGLALAHVRDLGPVFTEFARVLRPGGHLVVSDSRGYVHGGGGYPIVVRAPGGGVGYIPSWSHPTSAYLKAALPVGFQARHCDEPPCPSPLVDDTGTPPGDAVPVEPFTAHHGHPDIWSLHPWAVDATNAAYGGKPHVIVWHFQLSP